MNLELQRLLNPPGEARVERFGWTFTPGDKIMQTENDYEREVYNGDLGVMLRIDAEEGELVAEFDGREVTYGFDELDALVLAYATTIHKSQGSVSGGRDLDHRPTYGRFKAEVRQSRLPTLNLVTSPKLT